MGLFGLKGLVVKAVGLKDGVDRQYSFCRFITNKEGDNLDEWTEGERVATVYGDGAIVSDRFLATLLDAIQ